ncbi:MAG: aconitate hydratase AcnA [Deltaproteobacteria bacterium]|nr:MAG: aconitate hydratase AcnA [Deltaproteobacteria bacterium]
MTEKSNTFGARDTFELADGSRAAYYRLSALEEAGLAKLEALPLSVRVLLESALRNLDGFLVTEDDVRTIAAWAPGAEKKEFPFLPARVLLQDFTGVPAVVDLAALRNAMVELGGDPKKVNPLVPVDLVIDHSVQVDVSGRDPDAAQKNIDIEYERNLERYEFLKWGQKNLANFRAVPPGRGIVHQVNLEWIASVAFPGAEDDGTPLYYPDSLVGTDSHTPMVNGLGVLGWGVGGIEAEAIMLGQPIYMLTPDVIGFRVTGKLPAGVTATDMTLRIAQLLRQKGVVGKFVEFFGDGVVQMTLADRATIANMTPEYGATCCFFGVDQVTLDYLRMTGRDEQHVRNVEAYWRAQGMFRDRHSPEPQFTDVVELDLSTIEPALAGPKRPQDRIALSSMKAEFQKSLGAPFGLSGHGVPDGKLENTGTVKPADGSASYTITHGDVVIAAITSCTNTSNPSVMLSAGLLARNARRLGLTTKPWVKPSLAPGSRVVTDYYEKAGLLEDLSALGFSVVGYGCTTCIGNSGPLDAEIGAAIDEGELVAASVLSGNRNFEGRIHPKTKANFLASPPLVVAYAIAGSVNVDLTVDPIGTDANGKDVFLRDIWPSDEEIRETIRTCVTPDLFEKRYGTVTEEPRWDAIEAVDADIYPWRNESTYVQLPPFFQGMTPDPAPIAPIQGARVLLKLGDSITTDHISPAGAIPANSPAGKWLQEQGVTPKDFNSYGSRRGNHEVMMRGTFANVRIRNHIAPGTEGGYSTYFPTGETMFVYDASMKYQADGTPLIVLAGEQYGSGSSRDWAAKGTLLLGIKAVLAESYERIHRSNLVGMGILPLRFRDGETADTLGLDGTETFDIIGLDDDLKAGQTLQVKATAGDGGSKTFDVIACIDTPVEVEYYRNGGILHTVLRNMARKS